MTNFRRYNNIAGWIIFFIALMVYWLTVEPTASFWDAGEFIATSYKLQVPHPPGAPFYLLMGRLFSFLSFGDVYNVAYWVNMVSVVASAFTILFLFWTITLLGRKVLNVIKGEETSLQTTLIIIAGIVGALAYTFSDSFWFSAVESEVYGMSSFFTAIVFWAILKWETKDDPSESKKWLILIAYLMGLSIGVHLLNLVTIPAMGLVYYFKTHKNTSGWGILATLIISGAIILIINDGIIPGLPTLAASFEIFFVNTIGLPFGSGIVFFVLIVIGSLVWGIIYTQKKAMGLLNTALLSLAFILIGYSSYSVIVIRSNFNPPIDQNNPENIISFVSYLKREQYGYRPLIHGQYFDAEIVDQKRGAPIYIKGDDKYIISEYRVNYVYDPNRTTLFPRAYSSNPNHVALYRQKMNLAPGDQPNFFHNIMFMFRHQIGHMYMRYFMWNFSGRESDIQNAGWLKPWSAFEQVPELIRENKGRNNYFMLPLILGIVGLFFQYNRDPKSFSAVIMLFFLTGLALVLYLNSPPIEPRERDYIYVGSFYAFAIWIGFGAMSLAIWLQKLFKGKREGIALAFALSLSVPAIMAIEGWDDHDRSNRYFSVDSAKNFLASCAPNAVLFTGGDNDTFPLWYAQEVEGFRTDVRVVVLSYFNTDWYIEQKTRPINESAALPISFDSGHYRQGGPNDFIIFRENPNIKGPINVEQYLELIKNQHQGLLVPAAFSQYNSLPSRTMFLNVDTARVKSLGIIPEGKEHLLTDRMVWGLKSGKNGMEKNTLMLLDMIVTNNWERPIYFNNTSLMGISVELGRYVVQEGNAYRLLPLENPDINELGEMVNTEIMYDNLMNNFHYRELDNPRVDYNEDYRQFVLNHRASFNSLAEALLREGKTEKASEIILKNLRTMPDEAIPYDFTTAKTVDLLYAIDEHERALEISQIIGERSNELLAYYTRKRAFDRNDFARNLAILRDISITLNTNGEMELAQRYNQALQEHYNVFQYMDLRR
jgi:hypothetical protein